MTDLPQLFSIDIEIEKKNNEIICSLKSYNFFNYI